MSEPILSIRDLHAKVGGREVLQGLSLEVGAGTQFVSRASMPPGESALLPGWFDLQARLRWKRSRFFFTARAQSSAFLTFDQVLLVNTLLAGAGSSTPLLAGYLGADHSFAGAKLTPQLLLRVVQPATVRSQLFGGNAPPPGLASSVLVLREGGRSRLVAGDPATLPTLGAKLARPENLVINVMGRVFMDALDDPFAAVERELNACPLGEAADAIVVDVHAEATSEKMAMGHFCDGRASLVVGTHTHAPTADAQIFPGGTAFQSDAGACADSRKRRRGRASRIEKPFSHLTIVVREVEEKEAA